MKEIYNGLIKKKDVEIASEDMREGLTCVLSVKVPDPKFSSQTKEKLVSSEVRPVVESVVNEKLSTWFEEHPVEAKQYSPISLTASGILRNPVNCEHS